MKTNNRISARITAFVLSLVMLFTFSVPVFSAGVKADEKPVIEPTKYYTIGYNSEAAQLVLTLNAERLGELVANRDFTKNELKEFLPDILVKAIENKEIPSLQEIIDFIPTELLTYDELTNIIPEEVIKSVISLDMLIELVGEDDLNELTVELVDKLFTEDVVKALFTVEILKVLLTDEVLDKVLDEKDHENIFTDEVLDEILTEEVIKAILTAEQIDKLLKADATALENILGNKAIDKLLTKDAIKKLLKGNADYIQALVDAKDLKIEDVQECLTDKEILEAVVEAQRQQEENGKGDVDYEMIKIAAANDDYVDQIITKLIANIDEDKKDVSDVLLEDAGAPAIKVKDAIGIEAIIEAVGYDVIVDELGYDAIIAEVGYKAIIAEVGYEAIIEAAGSDVIIDAVTYDEMLDVIKGETFEELISLVGAENIASTIGVKNILKAIGRDKIKEIVDKDKLVDVAKQLVTKVFWMIDSLDIITATNGEPVRATVMEYTNMKYELYLEELVKIIAKSVPTVDTVKNLEDGSVLYDIAFELAFADVEDKAKFELTVKVEGDTTQVKHYAQKIFNFVNSYIGVDYELNGGLDLVLSYNDTAEDAPITLAAIFAKALESDRLSDARKAQLLTIFTKTGDELIENLEELDIDMLADIVNAVFEKLKADELYGYVDGYINAAFDKLDINGRLPETLDAKDYVSRVVALRDKAVEILEMAMDKVPEAYATVSLSDLYKGDGHFSFSASASASTDKIIDKFLSFTGISKEDFDTAFAYDKEISGSISVDIQLQNIYRVNFYEVYGGEVIYTTFLPVGADLSIVTDNTLAGVADSWKSKDGDVVATMPAEDINLYAKAPEKYTATFKADGKIVAEVKFYEGDTELSEVPDVPAKKGYSGEWADYKLENKDLTIEAVYTANVYTATFVYEDGSVYAVLKFSEGKFIDGKEEPEVPAKRGYTGKWEDYELGYENITIEPEYTENPYTIVFDPNGAIVGPNGKMSSQNVMLDVEAKLSKNTYVRSGYNFLGWNTKADGSGVAYADGAAIKNLEDAGETITLYAQWEVVIVVPVYYTATFMVDGRIVAKVIFFDDDKELSTVPEVPTKKGYTGAWETYTLESKDIVINAKYTALDYTISFDANGGTGTMEDEVVLSEKYVALTKNAFTKDGYKFVGWNTKADGTGDAYADGKLVKDLAEVGETVKLYAQWEAVAESGASSNLFYTATFKVDDKVVDVVVFFEGDTELYREPAVPAKEGYTGVWEEYTLGSENIVIKVIYTEITTPEAE